MVDIIEVIPGVGGALAGALIVEGNSLVRTYEWAFLFGPGLVVGFGNGLMLGYLMYKSGLVPRRMTVRTHRRTTADPLLPAAALRRLRRWLRAGVFMALPEIIWEAFLCIYCAWKGFRTDSSLAQPAARAP